MDQPFNLSDILSKILDDVLSRNIIPLLYIIAFLYVAGFILLFITRSRMERKVRVWADRNDYAVLEIHSGPIRDQLMMIVVFLLLIWALLFIMLFAIGKFWRMRWVKIQDEEDGIREGYVLVEGTLDQPIVSWMP